MLARGQEWLLVEPGDGGLPWRLAVEPGNDGRYGSLVVTEGHAAACQQRNAEEAGHDGGS